MIRFALKRRCDAVVLAWVPRARVRTFPDVIETPLRMDRRDIYPPPRSGAREPYCAEEPRADQRPPGGPHCSALVPVLPLAGPRVLIGGRH